MDELIAQINTRCRKAGVPLYFVVTGPGQDPETKSASELTDEEIADLTAVEIHIQRGIGS